MARKSIYDYVGDHFTSKNGQKYEVVAVSFHPRHGVEIQIKDDLGKWRWDSLNEFEEEMGVKL